MCVSVSHRFARMRLFPRSISFFIFHFYLIVFRLDEVFALRLNCISYWKFEWQPGTEEKWGDKNILLSFLWAFSRFLFSSSIALQPQTVSRCTGFWVHSANCVRVFCSVFMCARAYNFTILLCEFHLYVYTFLDDYEYEYYTHLYVCTSLHEIWFISPSLSWLKRKQKSWNGKREIFRFPLLDRTQCICDMNTEPNESRPSSTKV